MERSDGGYELFRRAIVEQDADAWATIYVRYRSLLAAWAARSCAHGEACADIADQALARAWMALTPERFAAFSTLRQLLAYLRTCVATAAIDSARAQGQFDSLAQDLPGDSIMVPEQIVLADLGRSAFWRTVLGLTRTPAERVALVESFAHDLPPRAIQARHPQLFPDVAAVYAAKRNLLDRLRRHPDVLRLREEPISW
jgi:DNA-directed RNA polymerase specialized sigma24 family protein